MFTKFLVSSTYFDDNKTIIADYVYRSQVEIRLKRKEKMKKVAAIIADNKIENNKEGYRKFLRIKFPTNFRQSRAKRIFLWNDFYNLL